MAKAKGSDAFAEYEQATAHLEEVREAHRADPVDAYLKLQYRAAQEAVQRARSFWRSVDATVAADDPNYGRPTGDGRRGGEFIHIDEKG